MKIYLICGACIISVISVYAYTTVLSSEVETIEMVYEEVAEEDAADGAYFSHTLPGDTPSLSESTNGIVRVVQNGRKDIIYTVQLGAFESRERAFALYWELSTKLSPLMVTSPNGDALYRVHYGSFPNKKEAQEAANKIRHKGIQCFVTAVR